MRCSLVGFVAGLLSFCVVVLSTLGVEGVVGDVLDSSILIASNGIAGFNVRALSLVLALGGAGVAAGFSIADFVTAQ